MANEPTPTERWFPAKTLVGDHNAESSVVDSSMKVILAEIAEQTETLAASWAPLLGAADKATLFEAFEMAETYALFALECAVDQVDERYREELLEQIDDERRHIGVFSEWRSGSLREMNKIRRIREDYVWFTLLLVNELTGYCQFRMLRALVDTDAQRQDVERICFDEERHIHRLIRWVRPISGTPRVTVSRDIVTRFKRELPQRMRQFMPRDGLEPLRCAIAERVGLLLQWVVDELLVLPTAQLSR